MAKKILLADDSPTIRKVVELTFADEGIDVFSVPDGDAAMVKFVEIEPDVVIADVNMPGMNGYRLCEMIKEDDSTRHIPVILLVGSFEPFDAGEASRVGSDYYFTKPFRSIRELVEKVHECLGTGSISEPLNEVADIETLYQQSFEPEPVETTGPEADILTFGSAAPEHQQERSEDAAPLDEYFPEQHAEKGDDAKLPVLRMAGSQAASTAAAPAVESARQERDAVNGSPRPAENAKNLLEDLDDDVLGLGGGVATPDADDDELVLDFGRPPVPVSAPPRPAASGNVLAFSDHPPARTTGGLGPSPWEQQVATSPAAEQTVQPERQGDAFGDPGMDDEIIETTHPRAASAAGATYGPNGGNADPFNEPVDPRSRLYDTGDFGQTSGFESSGIAANSEYSDEPRPSSETGQTVLDPAVSPQMIETIVARVLERLSDRAVRDAAQEAVPRIAEKLIREALVDEQKQ